MLRSWHAEMIKIAKRPAAWLLLALAVTLAMTFAYRLPYLAHASGSGAELSDRALAMLLPDQLVGSSLGGLPVFLGAIMLILGVLVVGGEYAWGTWKVLLTQGPSRLVVYGGKLLALITAAAVLVLTLFASGAIASALVAAAESQSMAWPPPGDLMTGFGAGWLIAAMWAVLGGLLGIALRAVALPVGLGLVWMLAIQNLLAT